MYEEVLKIEDQLLCPEVQAQVGDEYSEMKNSIAQFQRKLRQVIVEAKRKRGSTTVYASINGSRHVEKVNVKSLALNF